MPWSCVRGARGRFGGVGAGAGCCVFPVSPCPPRVSCACVWRAVPSGCPLSSLAGTPFHAVCAFRGLGPVALLFFPACPLCLCALALSRRPRPPPLPGLVWRAHLARSRCWALVGPFHAVRAPPRFLPRSRAPFGLLGGGAARSRFPLPGCGCVGVRAWGPVTKPTARALASWLCALWGRHEDARGGRLLPGCGAPGVGRSPTPNRSPSGRATGAHYPPAVGVWGCGRGDPSPTPQRALLRAGFARCGGGTRTPRGGRLLPGCGAPGVRRSPTPDRSPSGRTAGAHYPLAVGVWGCGRRTRHQPHCARSCELALRAVGAARGRPGGAPLALVWGAWAQALSHPRPLALWAYGRGPLPTGCGCVGVRGRTRHQPHSALLRAGFARCGGGARTPGGGASCLGVGRLGSGALPAPTARPLGVRPGPTTHWLWVLGGCGRGDPSPTPQRALLRAGFARCGGGTRTPGGGASCLGVGRLGSGALPAPTARPLGVRPGPTTHWLWVCGGAGVGTRHQPHSARSCELALRAVGAARGRPGGAPLAWVWGASGQALSHPRPLALWAYGRGPLPTGCGCGGVRAWGPVTNPTARALASWLCALWGRHEDARGGHLLPGCGAPWVRRSPTPDCSPSGRTAGAHYPLAVGVGGCGRGDPSPTPQRALLRAGFARCGGGTRTPGGGASCLGVGRLGSGALPPPTARPLGVRPGPTTHWLWVCGGAGVGTRHQPHSARSCELALRAVGAARGRPGGAPLAWGWGASGQALSHPRPLALWAYGRGPLPTGCGCGGVRAWGPVTNPTARALACCLCALWGRREDARGGRLLPGCGAPGVRRSPTPDRSPSGRTAGAHYPLAVGVWGCGRGDPSPTPQRALLRAGFARCGGGTRTPGGGASCLGVGRLGSGALPPPTARPLGVRPGPTTHWLWVCGGAGVGTRHQPHSARSCELALRAVGAARGRPGGGASCLGVGRLGSGALPPPTARPLGVRPGPTTHWLWVWGGAGVGTRHQPHSARSCELALRAVGAARGRPGGAPLAWVWGALGQALSHPRPLALWAYGRGPLPTGCGCVGVRAWGPVTNPTARALASWLCALWGRHEDARGGRLWPGCGAPRVRRSPTPDRSPSGRTAGAHYPLAVGVWGCGRGDPSPTPQRTLLRAGFARCGGGTRTPGGGASGLGVGRLGSGALPPPTARPLGVRPGPTAHWLWVWGGAGVGTRHQPHSARSCELALRAVGAARGRPGGAPLAWVWGALGQALSHPRLLALWAYGRGPLPTGCGCGGVRAWGPVTNPTARALASWLCALWGRHEDARGGRLLPGCGAPWVRRSPTPDRSPSGRTAGAHYPLAVGVWGCGRGDPSPTPQRTLLRAGFARCGGGTRTPGGGASGLGVGRLGSGALPPPTARPLGVRPGPGAHWLWVWGGAGVGTRHQPHSARSCVLSLRAVGAARGRPGGAPLAWVWGALGQALSHPRPLALWAYGRGPLPTGCGCGGVRAWGPVTNPTTRALASWLCALWGRHEDARGGRLLPGCGAPGVRRSPTPDRSPSGRTAGAHYPLAVGVWGCGRGDPLPTPQRALLRAGFARCGGGTRTPGGGRLLPGCGAPWVRRSPTPDRSPSGRTAGAHYPLAVGVGGCGRGDPSPTPQRALLRAGFARCGGGTRTPGGGASCLGVGRLRSGALPPPTARPLGVRPGPTTHWLWVCGGAGVGTRHQPHSARSCELALRAVGAARGRPGGGASCLGVGRLGSGALPPPTARPLGVRPGPTTHWLWVWGGAGVGTRHQPHSARSCELALRAVGAARGRPGGAPLAWVWGALGQALSHPRPLALWAYGPGPLPTGCGCGGVRAWGPVTNPTARALARWLCALWGRREDARGGRLLPGCGAPWVRRSPTPDRWPSGRAAGAHYPLAVGVVCGRGDPALLGTFSCSAVRCVLCALPGFAAPGGRCGSAPVLVPWLWPAACLSGVPRGPALLRRASSGPVALGAPVGFPGAVVPFPIPVACAPGFTGRLRGARGGRPRTGLIVPAAGPRRSRGAGLAPRRTRSGPRDGVVPGGSLRRRSWAACAAVVCVCGPGH